VTDNLASSGGNKFSIGAMVGSLTNVAVTLSGQTALADLIAIDQATNGFITAAGVTSLSGSVTDLRLVTDNLGSGANKFSIGTMNGNITGADLTVTGATVSAANLLLLEGVTDGDVSTTSGATVTGDFTALNSLSGKLGAGVALPTDFKLVVTGVVSTTIDSGLPGLLTFFGENTSGTLRVEGTGANNTLNFGATTDSLIIDSGDGNDTITGTAYGDRVIGGAGSDTVNLGSGADVLVFNSLSGVDTVNSFSSASDEIELAKAVLTALGSLGDLTAAEFESGAGLDAATAASTRIFFNSTSGALYYDADGSGAGSSAQQVATFNGGVLLTVEDFFIA
jgi:Ca2+-binding RTX toxin-like protein